MDDGKPSTTRNTTRVPGWTIRFTGETFDDYEKFLERHSFYRTPQFTCSSTGQSNLTFEQAQLSERAARHMTTGVGFSDMLICEMLTFLSQSTLSISMAVDALFYRFQYDFFLNEHIDVRYPGTDGAMYECFVVSIGPLTILPEENVIREQSSTDIAIERLGPGAREIVAYEQRKQRMFTVRLFDMEGRPIEDSDISVRAEELSRSRNVFTKVALRQFLDENMMRGARPGSPWVVRHEWRERFRIPYLFGGEARLLRLLPKENKTNKSKIKSMEEPVDLYADERFVSVKPVRKFPIEDLDLCTMQHVKWNQGVVWALRNKRRHQAEDANKKKQGEKGSRQITDFFAVKKQSLAEDAPVAEESENIPADDLINEMAKYRWPVPLSDWQVPAALVSRMLSTFMFVSCFSSSIKLRPYSLDFFESSLVHDTPSSVYCETVAALLNVIGGAKPGRTDSVAAARVASRGKRTLQPSAMSSSAVVSEVDDSEVDDGASEASTMAPPGSPKNPARTKRRANGRRNRVSVSRAASESETEPDEEPEEPVVVADVVEQQQQGHALLQHLSRSWWLAATADSDAWALALAGWLVEARTEYPKELGSICDALWGAEQLSHETIVSALWAALGGADGRLTILELLVCACTGVAEIREYLEQTAETAMELKRERIEVRREIRRIAEQLQELDKAEADEQQRLAVSREQGRREKEAELMRQKERRRLGETERTMQRRLDNVERDLRRNTVGRLVPLGVDRFLTRYYFLDGIGDCPLAGAGAGSGRLLVQPAPLPEVDEAMAQQPRFVRAMRALQISWTWAGGCSPLEYLGKDDEAVAEIPADALAGDEHLARLAQSGELWGYYATTRQVDALRRWLDARGRREAALEAELDLVHLALSTSIRKRCHTLDASFEARVRIRQSIADRIAALGDGDDAESLNAELAEFDRSPVPRALLPPAMLVGEPPTTSDTAGNGSSRASSVEPSDLFVHQASLHASSKRQAGRRGRRARAHHRSSNALHPKRPRTFIDDFLDYTNN
ncbi:hypothetical protein LPJ64_001567 [Coemansia asiatica]|uniref:WAC domain-containing protein n=1 Tax=Coemansia asiatica TaxID=1052880 RepID=A0A9W7XNQ6_9FUNG|nr:hypothetical protein LPJ64_001567 [Coemansia asiatica]